MGLELRAALPHTIVHRQVQRCFLQAVLVPGKEPAVCEMGLWGAALVPPLTCVLI